MHILLHASRAWDSLQRVLCHLHEYTPTFTTALHTPRPFLGPLFVRRPAGVMAVGLQDPGVNFSVIFPCPHSSRCFHSFVLEISYCIYYATGEHLDSFYDPITAYQLQLDDWQ